MENDWGVVGCAYMSQQYCKVLISRGIEPKVFSRDLNSSNVRSFRAMFPGLAIERIEHIRDEPKHWLVCTNIESHEQICAGLTGTIYCEKPYAHTPDYDADRDITVLMNRRYYYWIDYMKSIIDDGRIIKVIANVPEKSADALITQSIHVIDLLWYLCGSFQPATRIGRQSPSFMLSTDNNIPIVINMNYGSHENFSLRFYSDDGVVYEARPLEAFSIVEGMKVHEPSDEFPLRSYQPVIRRLEYVPTDHKPGLAELVDALLQGTDKKLPTLSAHRKIHAWMRDNMS
jgi:predicted dehydrogenase